MPYVFEATFTQPLLQKLDNGIIKGSEDWAKAITEAYINTIKTGLPQGTPPTLPAPSQQGAPFPMGADSFRNAKSREKVMYNVIYAYFYAKELKLDKDSIQGAIQTVKQLYAKIRHKQQQIKSLIEQIKLITQQISNLPKLLKEIIEGLKQEIKRRIEDLKNISSIMDNLKANIGFAKFDDFFKNEASILNTIKNFKITDAAAIKSLADFTNTANKQMDVEIDSELLQTKKYLKSKLLETAKTFTDFGKAVVDPTSILDLLKGMVGQVPYQTKSKIQLILNKVISFDNIIRSVQPKLEMLNKRKVEKIKELRDQLQTKIADFRKKLDDKIGEFTKKVRNGKAVSLYKKATKTINDLKKKNEEKITKVKNNIVLLNKAYQNGTKLYNQSKALSLAMKTEFDAIKQQIGDMQKSIQTQLDQKKQGIGNIAENAKTTITKITPTRPDLKVNKQKFNNITQDKIDQEILKQKNYFDSLNMGDFANLGAMVITQTQCDFTTFKSFFERRNQNMKQYVGTILEIESNIKGLVNTLQTVQGNSQAVYNIKVSTLRDFLENRITSMKDLIDYIIRTLQPKIEKLKIQIKEKLNKVKNHLKTHLQKFADNIKKYAENMIPIQSVIQDIKDKKAYIESKIAMVKDKIKKVKKILKKIALVSKMAKGFAKLVSNIAVGGKYKYSENNQAINDTLDGYYGFKMEDQDQTVVLQLQKEKERMLEKFKVLLVVETLVYGLLETFKDMKSSGFGEDIKQTINNTTTSPVKDTLIKLQSIAINPPTNPKSVKELGDSLGTDMLNNINVASSLVDLERKHLAKSREFIKTLCDIKELEKTKHYIKLIKIKTTLEKNQSYIILAFDMVKRELAEFLSMLDIKVREVMKKIMDYLSEKRKKIEEAAKRELEKWAEKKINVEAPIMSFCFQLATTMFWAGANWKGPTGSTHITTTLGPFKPIKAKTTDGASKMIKEIAKSFETQLKSLQGLLIAPPSQGIPPVPWVGYK